MNKNELLEIIFLLKHKVIYEKNNEYYYDWRRIYKVNPSEIKKRCFEKELYVEATPEEILNTYKVSELKEILKSKELKISGKKSNLIDRIIEAVSEDEIKKEYSGEMFYSLSNKGQELIQEFAYLELYEHYLRPDEIDIYDYYKASVEAKNPYFGLMGILMDQASEYLREGKYYYLKHRYIKLSELSDLIEDYEGILEYTIKIIYLEMSGLGNDIEYFPEEPQVYYNNIKMIDKALENLDKTVEDLDPYYLKAVEELSLPKKLFEDIKVYEFILKMMDGRSDEVEDEIQSVFDNYDVQEEFEESDLEDKENENLFVTSKVDSKNEEELIYKIKSSKDENINPEKIKFFKTKWFVILSYIAFWPLGIFLGLKYKIFDKKLHIGIGIAILLMMFLGN